MTKIAMLGLGSMNGAILGGLLSSGVPAENVTATTRSQASAEAKAEQYGVRVFSEEAEQDANAAAVAQADVVFLGVKPYQIVELCQSLKGALKPESVVVSVAAAITVKMMESAFDGDQSVIRSMPNTPLSVGLGVVGLASGTHATDKQVQLVRELFSGAGEVHVMPEEQIDMLTGVAGSGPAYVFYLAEHMAAAGVQMGLSQELADDLAAQTVYGAGKMLVENRGTADAAQLRRNVTSPNGTTQKAIETFDAAAMAEIITAGAKASSSRAAELTRQLEGE